MDYILWLLDVKVKKVLISPFGLHPKEEKEYLYFKSYLYLSLSRYGRIHRENEREVHEAVGLSVVTLTLHNNDILDVLSKVSLYFPPPQPVYKPKKNGGRCEEEILWMSVYIWVVYISAWA